MPIDRSRIRPSFAWLALSGVAVVAGIVVAVLIGVGLFGDVTGDFDQLNGPRTVQLDKHEGRGIWVDTDRGVSGFCSARGPEQVDMERTHGVTVTSGGTEYHSFLRFKAPQAGTYTVDCATSRPVSLGPYITAGRIFVGVGGILGSFFGGLLLGALILCLVLILRERSKRKLELEASPQALR